MSKRPIPGAVPEETGQKRSCLRSNKNKQCPTTSRQQDLGEDFKNIEECKNLPVLEDFTTEQPASSTGIVEVPLRGWQSNRTINECLINVYNHERWTDMVIRCGENGDSRPLKAHKVILAARSPVFEAMLFGPCSELKEVYVFPDADVEIFEMMLRYMYCESPHYGDCDYFETKPVNHIISLIQLAHMYQLSLLVNECASYLENKTRTQTELCQILDCALKYDIRSLRDFCCRLIDADATAVIQSQGFLSLSQDGLLYILKGDTLYADEELIFARVEEWATLRLSESGEEINGNTIREVLGEAFYYCRLPTLDLYTLMKCIKHKGYFSASEYEEILNFKSGHTAEINCMSVNGRVPVRESVELAGAEVGSMTSKTLNQSLSIILNKDICLNTISFSPLHLFLEINDEEVKIEDDCRYVPVPKKGKLNCDIYIEQAKFHKQYSLCLIDGESQIFPNIDLYKEHSPINLTIEISCAFDTILVLDCSYGRYKQSTDSDVVSVTEDGSDLFVKAFSFSNCSFREDKKLEKESKKKSENSMEDC